MDCEPPLQLKGETQEPGNSARMPSYLLYALWALRLCFLQNSKQEVRAMTYFKGHRHCRDIRCSKEPILWHSIPHEVGVGVLLYYDQSISLGLIVKRGSD